MSKITDTSDFWRRVLELLPEEFNVPEVGEIRQYLLTNLKHKVDFAASIHQVMTT
ncbi:MAG: hypothetical protein NWR72_20365 [Bacteroidia bacterium]|nr:hypothetical protein [Bacteroidia bacterium]